jgi:hypothetical protein
MPDRLAEFMNAQLREAAGRGVINLGQPPAPSSPSSSAEPPAEPHISMDKWVKWARTVEHRFDNRGYLPGEDGYDPTRRGQHSAVIGWEARANRWLADRKLAARKRRRP